MRSIDKSYQSIEEPRIKIMIQYQNRDALIPCEELSVKRENDFITFTLSTMNEVDEDIYNRRRREERGERREESL